MAENPRFLRVMSLLSRGFAYWPWPINSLGRPVSTFVANALFQQVTNPTTAVSDAIPEGGIGTDLLPSGDMQEVTNQGNKTTDWLETGGYAMDSFPIKAAPTSVAVVSPAELPYYNQGNVSKELVGKLSLADFAALLKPYLESSTPSPGPTVANAIPNQTITVAGSFVFNENTFTGSGLTFTVTKSDGSAIPFGFNGGARRFTFDSNLTNGSTEVTVKATDSTGKSITTNFTITIAYAAVMPYIISILRKFDPVSQTLFYLVQSSYTGNDLTLIPADRSKRAEESNWRTQGGAFLSSQDTWGFSNDIIAQYPHFWRGNLTIEGNPVTNTVVQFKPYVGAPDSAIITLNFTHTNVQDYGTEVYHYSAGSAKMKEFYVGRYQDTDPRLACYAEGSGVLKTNLVATGSTPTYSPSIKAMLTEPGGYPFDGLFTGKKAYGSLYRNVPNGSYDLSLIDEDGNTLTFPIVVTDAGPVATLKAGGGTIDPVDPGTGGGGDTPSSTAVETANRDLFIPAVQWSGGKARVVHTNKPSGNGIYLISGQNEVANLPTTYDFEPGDEVEITFVQGVTSSSDFASWPMTKAQVIIRFGQAPA